MGESKLPGIVRYWKELAGIAYSEASLGHDGYSIQVTARNPRIVPPGAVQRIWREELPLPGALLVTTDSAVEGLADGHALRGPLIRLLRAFPSPATSLLAPGLREALGAAILAYEEWERQEAGENQSAKPTEKTPRREKGRRGQRPRRNQGKADQVRGLYMDDLLKERPIRKLDDYAKAVDCSVGTASRALSDCEAYRKAKAKQDRIDLRKAKENSSPDND